MTLAVGAEAPDFTLKDQNGQPVTLTDFRGKKNVLLVFFPLAFTGICQGELDEIRDNLPDYDNDDTATLAISVGPRRRTRSGPPRAASPSRCCPDFWPHGAVAEDYGVFNSTVDSPTAAPSSSTGPAWSGSPNARNPVRPAIRRCGPPRWTRSRPDRDFLNPSLRRVTCRGSGV